MTIELEILVIAAVVIGLVSAALGYWWAAASQRRAAGGKSVAEMAAEKEQYQQDVEEHFKASADLLNEMTDKYRDVYRHMAEGAQRLVPGENVAPALAALQSGLLGAPGAPAREATVEPAAENSAHEDASISSGVSTEEAAELDGKIEDLQEPIFAQQEHNESDAEIQNKIAEEEMAAHSMQNEAAKNEQDLSDNAAVSAPEKAEDTDFFANDTVGTAQQGADSGEEGEVRRTKADKS